MAAIATVTSMIEIENELLTGVASKVRSKLQRAIEII